MMSIIETAGRIWRELAGRLVTRSDTTAIDSVAALQDFIATRSAYVAQKTLYGYVKARMGSRHPRMFEDDRLVASLNIAKQQVFAACASDLTVYAVATVLHDHPIGNDARRELARCCYRAALSENAAETPEQFSAQDRIDEFGRRLEGTDWRKDARQPENFTDSPRALYRWAPITEDLKKYDAEIVENSIRFAWRVIREDFLKRADRDAIHGDWLRQTKN